MQHAALIKDLGGTGVVAAKLGQNDSTVSNWKKREIPWRFRPAVADLAQGLEVTLPDGFLDPSAAGADQSDRA